MAAVVPSDSTTRQARTSTTSVAESCSAGSSPHSLAAGDISGGATVGAFAAGGVVDPGGIVAGASLV